MIGSEHLDAYDPIRRSYRQYLTKLKAAGLLIVMLAVCVLLFGVPHVQTTYTLHQSRVPGRMPTAAEKRDAWYWSVTGKRRVFSGQYGNEGCPWLLFIPLWDCLS